MTEDGFTRRRVLQIAGGVAPALLLANHARGGDETCPKGTRLVRWETYSVPVSYEFELNFGYRGNLGGGKIKWPGTKVMFKAVCEPYDPPPPPPPMPAPRSGHYVDGLYDGWNMLDSVQLVARNCYFNIGLPAFVQFASNSATLTMESVLASGAVSRLAVPLIRDEGGFVMAAPTAADQFIGQSMHSAEISSWTLSDIELSASSAGSGYAGVGLHVAGHKVGGISALALAGGRDSGPGVFDPEAVPMPPPSAGKRRR